MHRKNKLMISVLAFILIIYAVNALNFITPPNINNLTQAKDDVICSWATSGDTTQTNVSWYKNSVFEVKHASVGTSSDILTKNYTQRGENWTCEVTITNTTSTLAQNTSVIIQNSDPNSLAMYNQSNDANLGNTTALNEDTTYNFYLNATDYDNDPLSYSFDNSINATLTSGGLFSWTPDYYDNGTNNVTLLVFDDQSPDVGTDGFIFTMIVALVNDAPVFSPSLQYQNSTEGTYFEYVISAADEESNFPLNFTIISDDGIGLNLTFLNSTHAKLNFTPDFLDAGNHTITIKVEDSLGASNQSSFLLEVSPINHAPTFTYIQNASANQSQLFTMNINASDIDINDLLTFNISSPGCQYTGIWNITTLSNSSNNSVGLINVTLTNQHIVCKNVTLSVTDSKETTQQTLTLNITNLNDAPIIYDNSTYGTNTFGNINITNITAYPLVEFRYRVNFTDIDNLTYEGENYTITDNSTLFNINQTTGLIAFIPNQSIANQTFLILLNSSDDDGLWTTKTMVLNIKNNSAPVIIPQTPNMTGFEDVTFIYDFNASDTEGDNITYSINYSTISTLNIDTVTGIINFVPNQTHIGNQTITVRATDTLGTYDQDTFILQINNTNDAPILYNMSLPIFVENITANFTILASDEDLSLPSTYENLTFWVIFLNSTTNYTDFFNITKINSTAGRIVFTPNASHPGNYTVEFGVNDSQTLFDNKTYNFTIYPPSLPPQIINITPHDTPTNFSWANASLYPGYTDINATEDDTILFNHSTYNAEANETLSYFWYYDQSQAASTYSYSRYFDFSSGGTHNVTLRVEDDKYGFDTFSWIVDVGEYNRPVQYIGDPNNLTITANTHYPDNLYLRINNATGVFYDPDDDANLNGLLDLNETNTLSYAYTYLSGNAGILNIQIAGENITFIPAGTGTVRYSFTASDGFSNVTTNPVQFNVSYTPVTEPVVITRTKTKPKYYQIEVEKIINLDILAPQAVTLYENNTARVPITIKNTGNISIHGITLTSSSQNDEIEMSFKKDFIETLGIGEETNTELEITSYRSQGTYEVEVKASVAQPSFYDTALIVVASIESDAGDIATAKTKIAYAQDLLSSNPKCLDLNEMLLDIQKNIDAGKLALASKKLDDVITTCRYLTSQKELIEESPNIISVNINRIRNNTNLFYSISIIIIISILGTVFSIYYTNKKQE
ncbi:hypothetical protein GOV08_04595 [Candidatus Woesearchaeota archaeon]|nr:hypothetical protein [Candidatus Woesearchaeota archaeon]